MRREVEGAVVVPCVLKVQQAHGTRGRVAVQVGIGQVVMAEAAWQRAHLRGTAGVAQL